MEKKTNRLARMMITMITAMILTMIMMPLYAEKAFAEPEAKDVNITYEKPYSMTHIASFKRSIRVTDIDGNPLEVYDIIIQKNGNEHVLEADPIDASATYYISVFIGNMVPSGASSSVIENSSDGAEEVDHTMYLSPDDGRYKAYVMFRVTPINSEDPRPFSVTNINLDFGETGKEYAEDFYTYISRYFEAGDVTYSGSEVTLVMCADVSAGGAVEILESYVSRFAEDNSRITQDKAYSGRVGVKSAFSEYDYSGNAFYDRMIMDLIEENQTFYLLWKEQVDTITLTAAAPKAGDEVNAEYKEPDDPESGYDWDTQWPRPQFDWEEDMLHIRNSMWLISRNELFTGAFNCGDECYAYAEILPNEYYYFADNAKMTVNGKVAEFDLEKEVIGKVYENEAWVMIKMTVDHDWAEASCDFPKKCRECSATEGEKLGHDLSDWEIIEEATAEKEGLKRRHCIRCEYVEDASIPKVDPSDQGGDQDGDSGQNDDGTKPDDGDQTKPDGGGQDGQNGDQTKPDDGQDSQNGDQTKPDGGQDGQNGDQTKPDDGQDSQNGDQTKPDGGQDSQNGDQMKPDDGQDGQNGDQTKPDGGQSTEPDKNTSADNSKQAEPETDRENKMGDDGTPVGKGASAEAVDKVITSMTSESDPKGSKYMPLGLKSVKQSKKSVTVKWSKAAGAVKYVVYGNKCGKGSRMQKIAELTGTSKAFSKIAGKKVAKGVSYKFIVVALDADNNVVSTSRLIHAYAKGGKFGNHKSVKVQLKSGRKWKGATVVKVGKGKSVQVRGIGVKAAKKMKYKTHAKMRYESSNAGVATVAANGKIKGVKKGTCYVYAYSQNGVAKKVKVTVK